jgi:hypothetical protein
LPNVFKGYCAIFIRASSIVAHHFGLVNAF